MRSIYLLLLAILYTSISIVLAQDTTAGTGAATTGAAVTTDATAATTAQAVTTTNAPITTTAAVTTTTVAASTTVSTSASATTTAAITDCLNADAFSSQDYFPNKLDFSQLGKFLKNFSQNFLSVSINARIYTIRFLCTIQCDLCQHLQVGSQYCLG